MHPQWWRRPSASPVTAPSHLLWGGSWTHPQAQGTAVPGRALLGRLPTFLTLDPHEALGTEANKRAWEVPAGPAVLAGL